MGLEHRRARMKADAARVGLPWPPSQRRRVGRPSRQGLREASIADAIKNGPLSQGVPLQVPGWWKPGLKVWRAEEEMEADLPPSHVAVSEERGCRGEGRSVAFLSHD